MDLNKENVKRQASAYGGEGCILHAYHRVRIYCTLISTWRLQYGGAAGVVTCTALVLGHRPAGMGQVALKTVRRWQQGVARCAAGALRVEHARLA